MSFELVCENCGAVSGPSVGICPYCKTSFAKTGAGEQTPEIDAVLAAHEAGRLEEAISLAQLSEQQNPALADDPRFALLLARILIEAEGPTFKIKSVLNRVLLRDPANSSARELLQLVEAKGEFTAEKNDEGERKMRALLRVNPGCDLALFLLGAHLFWITGDTEEPTRLLEQCVKLKPNFLRAWACLGSVYQRTGNSPLAIRCFGRCLALEANPEMKAFFQKQLSSLK